MATYTKEMVRNMLQTNDTAVWRAVKTLFERQTRDEQSTESTREHNGMGFTGFDAPILSSFAKQILRWEASTERRFPSPLSTKQIAIARKRLIKYSQQLANVANERAVA